ncbi:PDDEXK-like family protein [Kineococcus sp. SYSU DK018]|uniref:hypothetical protein n=1 Tax=Kineococcus sp. SYSU DK018 TaxID=3383139 RepID=UPI003D7DF299
MPVPITHLLPLNSENRWSDLLAVLVEADPSCAAEELGLPTEVESVVVHREVAATGRDRIDLVVHVDGEAHTVVEVKVLSGLGRRQLDRYREATATARAHVVVFPEALTIDVSRVEGWRPLTWERLITAFTSSSDAWVAETAHAWLEHLRASMPRVGPDTRWNDLRDGEDFVVAGRARVSWVFGQLELPEPIEYDLSESSAGVSWIVRMWAPAAKPEYVVLVEAEEGLTVRDYPKWAGPSAKQPRGPSVKVLLQQTGVTTSAGFDWHYLADMWPAMAAARSAWVQRRPQMKAEHDRAGWQSIAERGVPPFLGIGFGEGQTKHTRTCMFGARFQLPADVPLRQVVQTLEEVADLVLRMGAIEPSRRASQVDA